MHVGPTCPLEGLTLFVHTLAATHLHLSSILPFSHSLSLHLHFSSSSSSFTSCAAHPFLEPCVTAVSVTIFIWVPIRVLSLFFHSLNFCLRDILRLVSDSAVHYSFFLYLHNYLPVAHPTIP